jgi:hypothetical protein
MHVYVVNFRNSIATTILLPLYPGGIRTQIVCSLGGRDDHYAMGKFRELCLQGYRWVGVMLNTDFFIKT